MLTSGLGIAAAELVLVLLLHSESAIVFKLGSEISLPRSTRGPGNATVTIYVTSRYQEVRTYTSIPRA